MMYVLIILFLAFAALFFLLGLSYQNGRRRRLETGGDAPADDRRYWEAITVKVKKSAFAAAAGALLAALALALKKAVPAEIGCITVLAAIVYALGTLSKKTVFRPTPETLALQKKGKIILLIGSALFLILTQLVFRYFLSLE